MNEHTPTDAPAALPELSAASIDRIESAVFDEIAADRAPSRVTAATTRSRRRGWLTGIGVAAAFAAGVVVTPALMTITATTAGSSGDLISLDSDSSAGGAVEMAAPERAPVAADGVATDVAGREIIASASAALRVADVAAAADAVAALAEEYGGYVESTDISAAPMSTEASMPVPDGEYGWVSIRVPAAELTSVLDDLSDTGTVISSSTSKQDVTSMAIDLRARVDATRASVDRLTELMSQSGSVSDLIDAEVALTERQAQLESYTQQLAALEDQVAMSSLQVQLEKETSVTTAEPDGFADGLLVGWNGLIVSLNALVVAAGFALPWLAVAGAVVLVIWLILRRRSRASRADKP